MKRAWLVLIFASASLVGFAAAARALPCVAGCVYYFSDDTFTVQVGYKCWQCVGGPQISGTQTQYTLVDNPFDVCCGGGSGSETLCDYQYNPGPPPSETLVCY